VVTIGGMQVVNLCRFEELKLADDVATATDNYDLAPVITKNGSYLGDYMVYKRIGYYTLVYTATDGSGNVSVPVSRLINVEVCPWNGIADVEKAKMEVYPNPNFGEFEVNLDMPSTGKVKIIVTNLLGEVISEMDANSGVGAYHINIKGVSAGVYLVKAESSETILIQKVNVTK
jgi:hypothetical protein